MKMHEIINRNDPQGLEKFKALTKAQVCFAVTNINLNHDFTSFSVRANDLGMSLVKADANTFYFAPKQRGGV
jgi:hypothetical protein